MALFAIGDLHLSFSTDKSMDIWGGNWVNHEQKVRDIFPSMIRPEDTLVLLGDHSWGRNLKECEADLQFIAQLPGRKILTRGNHDLFWDSRHTAKLNKLYKGKLEFLQGGYAVYENTALVATKGYADEGNDPPERVFQLKDRELMRLQDGIRKAKSAGFEDIIVFLHYPPTDPGKESSLFTDCLEKEKIRRVIYAHCHGEEHFHDSLMGNVRGIEYDLVSGDYLNWVPLRLL